MDRSASWGSVSIPRRPLLRFPPSRRRQTRRRGCHFECVLSGDPGGGLAAVVPGGGPCAIRGRTGQCWPAAVRTEGQRSTTTPARPLRTMARSFGVPRAQFIQNLGSGSVCNWRAGNSARSRLSAGSGRLKRRLRPRLAALQGDVTQIDPLPKFAVQIKYDLRGQHSIFRKMEGIMAATRSKAKPLQETVHPQAIEPPPAPNQPGCPIVGIGASAGGLAAFEAFFSGMPAGSDPGMAFVLVQHLAPDHKSILTDLVKRYTRMQVFEVADGMAVLPNCAYIIPPNRDMAFLDGTLQLLHPVAPRGRRLPIDFFFSSLAQDQHERAICIVLSGPGSDGTLGVRAVKGEGGLVMAQNPESTEYDGMPRSAIATGLVDYVLQPAEMPAQLIAYVAHAFGRLPPPLSAPSPAGEDGLKKIFVLLRVQTGHDFSGYKRNTVGRRVERRMAVHQIERLEQYVNYLQQTPAEVDALFRDLMIGVTRFFRDPEAFAALEENAVPRLVANRPADALLRVWVPGCSTGEEAYSIAILLQERLDALKLNFKLQVFGTDIDRRAIDQARIGLYPAGIVADVSPERLERFFTREPGGGYRNRKRIREILIFSPHDLIKDPPFSKLDVVSCRNLLIYMEGELQKKLIPLFHYALNPGGMLFLGSSETTGEFVDLFAQMDRKAKLFLRKDGGGAYHVRTGRLLPGLTDEASAARRLGKAAESRPSFRELTEAALLAHYAPASALIDERGDILYLHGRTGQYLEPAPGEAGMNVLKMAREGLRRALTTALHKAVAHEEPARHAGLRVKTNGDFTTVNLTVERVSASPGSTVSRNLFLVILEKAPEADPERPQGMAADAGPGAAQSGTDADVRIAVLQHELRAKEDYLQTSNEELAFC